MGERNRVVLGIDPGLSNTGWALVVPEERRIVSSGKWRTAGEFSTADRIEELVERVARRVTDLHIDLVAVEAWVYFGHSIGWASSTTPRLIGEIKQMVQVLGVPFVEVPTVTAKKAIGLSGKVTKRRVTMAVAGMFSGEQPKNQHAVDAVVVAYAGARKMNETPLRRRR